MNENALEIKNIYKNFGKKELLKDISFSVKKGEIACFIGKNGVGKTTLFNIILEKITKNQGEIIFYNNYEKDVSFLYQERNFGESLTVNQLLNVIKSTIKKDNTKLLFFDYLCEYFDFEKIKKITISNLSGGQQQKLSLFQSIVTIPKILFLDEYSNNLDEITIEKVKTLFLKLAKEYQTSIVLISHKVEEIVNLIDRIFLLKNKKIENVIDVKNFTVEELEKLLENI